MRTDREEKKQEGFRRTERPGAGTGLSGWPPGAAVDLDTDAQEIPPHVVAFHGRFSTGLPRLAS